MGKNKNRRTKKGLQGTIRKLSKPEQETRECFICETRQNIENHHLVKVATLTQLLLKYPKITPEEIYKPIVDLCAEHHIKAHVLYGDRDDFVEIDEYEQEGYIAMRELIDVKEYEDEPWGKIYQGVVDRTFGVYNDIMEFCLIKEEFSTRSLEDIYLEEVN